MNFKKIILSTFVIIISVSSVHAGAILDEAKKLYENQNRNADKILNVMDKNFKNKKNNLFTEKDSDGNSILHYLVCSQECEDVIDKYLDYTSSILDKTKYAQLIDEAFGEKFPFEKISPGSVLIKRNGVVYEDVSPLFYCVLYGKKEYAKRLIAHGADVNKFANAKTLGHKETPLFVCVKSKDKDMMDLILGAHPDIDLGVKGIGGSSEEYSPLFQAIWNNDTASVKLLLANDANPNYKAKLAKKDRNGVSWVYTEWTPLLELYKSSEAVNIAELLISKGANTSVCGRKDSNTLMHYEKIYPIFRSIEEGDYSLFEKIYNKTENLNVKLTYTYQSVTKNYSLLLWAAEQPLPNASIISDLINEDTIMEEVITPSGRKRTVSDVLLEKNLPVSLFQKIQNIDSETRIHKAIDDCDYDEIKKLFAEKKSPNFKIGKRTAFEHAVIYALDQNGKNECMKIVEEFVSAGADINQTGSKGKSMLVYVIDQCLDKGVDSNRKQMIELLLKCGANTRIVVKDNMPLVPYIVNENGSNVKNVIDLLFDSDIQSSDKILYKPYIDEGIVGGENNNWNALCIAIKNNNADLMNLLIEKGSQVDRTIKENSSTSFTPLGLACLLGKKECAESLLNKGASTKISQQVLGARNVSIFMSACSSMPWAFVSRLLSLDEEALNKTDSLGRTGFMYAAAYNKNTKDAQQVLRNLRGRKANINQKTLSGENALSLALENNQKIETVMWLIQNGVKYVKPVSSENIYSYKEHGEEYSLLLELNGAIYK